MMLTSMLKETSSVVVAESSPLMVSRRLREMVLPPPPPLPPCSPPKRLPQPAVPSRVTPARPVPPILRKSLRVSRVAPGASPIPKLTVLVFIDPPFLFHAAARAVEPDLAPEIGMLVHASPAWLWRQRRKGSVSP